MLVWLRQTDLYSLPFDPLVVAIAAVVVVKEVELSVVVVVVGYIHTPYVLVYVGICMCMYVLRLTGVNESLARTITR